jgi:glycosyltransferase involved in cell wall biosynthesis
LDNWNCEGYDVVVYPYPRLPWKSYSYVLWNKLSRKGQVFYHSEGPFDLIHAHYLLPDGYLAYLYSKRYNLPYLITIRNADIKFLKKLNRDTPDFKKAELVIKNAGYILSPNAAYKDFFNKLFGIDAVIIPHGIDKDLISGIKAQTERKIIITTIAQAIRRKQIDWVIEAVRSYKGKENILLNIVGEGPLLSELKEVAGGDERIVFRGKLPKTEVVGLLSQSDIFALPSIDETFGMVYLEAAATGNALVGHRNEGVWGVFVDGSDMLFCSDEKDFEQKLYQLIDNEKLRSKLKEGALTRVKTLTWDKVSDQYRNIYRQTIERDTPGEAVEKEEG